MRPRTRLAAAKSTIATIVCAFLLLPGLPVHAQHAQKGKMKSQAKIQADNDRVFAREMKKVIALKARMKKRFSPVQVQAFRVEELAAEKRAGQEAATRYPAYSQHNELITLQGRLENKYQAQLRKKWKLTCDEWIVLLSLSSPE